MSFFVKVNGWLEQANFRAAPAKPLRSRVNGTFPDNQSAARATPLAGAHGSRRLGLARERGPPRRALDLG
jgi:hypothetical protein